MLARARRRLGRRCPRRCRGSSPRGSTRSPPRRRRCSGRRRDRQGLLARRARGDRRAPTGRARGAPARARAQGVRPPRAPLVGRGRERVRVPHVLVRDVAYGQIPRAERADKHRRAAEWIESLGRREDPPRCSRTTTSRRSSSRAPRGETRRRWSSPPSAALLGAAERAASLFAFAQMERFAAKALELAEEGSDRVGARAVLGFATAGVQPRGAERQTSRCGGRGVVSRARRRRGGGEGGDARLAQSRGNWVEATTPRRPRTARSPSSATRRSRGSKRRFWSTTPDSSCCAAGFGGDRRRARRARARGATRHHPARGGCARQRRDR